ncbi:MAG: dihydroorotase family protein, partial [archaeon]
KLGTAGKVNPPLRSEVDVEILWKNLGNVNFIASDHAPHTIKEKHRNVKDTAAGFPGVETTLPLLLNAANAEQLSWSELVRLTSGGASELFGLPQGIEVGNPANLVVLDRKKEQTIKADNLHSKCGWTPYEGQKVKGAVHKVFLRGELIVNGEEFTGKQGNGEEICQKL